MFDMYHQGIIYLVTTFTYNPYRIQFESLSFTHTVVPMINQDKEKKKKKILFSMWSQEGQTISRWGKLFCEDAFDF